MPPVKASVVLHSATFAGTYLTHGSTHMGKGDKRSKKGKIFRGSFGKRRPGKRRVAVKKAPAKSAAKR